MTWDQFVIMFDNWWSTVTFSMAALFVLYYGLCAPWYRTPFGRALIAIDLGLAVATFPTALLFVFNRNLFDNRVFSWVLIVVASTVPIAIAYRIITMWLVRHSPRWLKIRSLQKLEKHDEV